MSTIIGNYIERLNQAVLSSDQAPVDLLCEAIGNCWNSRRNIFICGNGGSAANAIHMANDFVYGVARKTGGGIRMSALPSNQAVLTCLSNDVGYEEIYSEQISLFGEPGDLLIVLSGSGNSKNIIRSLLVAKELGILSAAITGFDGGEARYLADISVHLNCNDMQLSEDYQTMVLHSIMQRLSVLHKDKS